VKARLAAATHHHGPVEQNCLGCHTPHASTTAPSLLTKPPPALCVGCHSPSQPGFGKAHLGYPVAQSNCLSCHDPHGSTNKGILWASVHAPVQNKQCVQCHGAPPATGPIAVKRTAPELCRGCHNALFVEIDGKRRVHAPVLERSSCANCHAPHASKTAGLLLAPQKQLCGKCHADSVARQTKSLVKHPPVDEGQCSTCHAPHAADQTFLFEQANVIELCGACHDWQNHTAHPLGDKAIDKRNPNLTVNCLSCHRSHGTAFTSFAHYDTKGELCTQCHIELAR
jgi:predicted CXXCH cytochrome family protein